MHRRSAEAIFKPVKQSSFQSADRKTDAWEEYQAQREATRERMAVQRAHRLGAMEAIKAKNRA